MPRALVPILLAALLLAGCAGAPRPLEPKTSDVTELARLRLEASIERASTTPGQPLVANFHLTNRGGLVVYETGGCTSTPWAFEVRAENGTIVAPLPPDPGCLGPPLTRAAIETNGALSHAFSWDAMRKWYAPDGSVQREPAAPGLYRLAAQATVERDEVPLRPAVELVFEVT